MSDSYKLGKDGETCAQQYLQRQGYQILETRWHLHHLEIDIIATDPKTGELVFVEVKTRASDSFGAPEEAVDYKKVMASVRAADAYIKQTANPAPWRFDIIAIMPRHGALEVDHIVEAFYPPLG